MGGSHIITAIFFPDSSSNVICYLCDPISRVVLNRETGEEIHPWDMQDVYYAKWIIEKYKWNEDYHERDGRGWLNELHHEMKKTFASDITGGIFKVDLLQINSCLRKHTVTSAELGDSGLCFTHFLFITFALHKLCSLCTEGCGLTPHEIMTKFVELNNTMQHSGYMDILYKEFFEHASDSNKVSQKSKRRKMRTKTRTKSRRSRRNRRKSRRRIKM